VEKIGNRARTVTGVTLHWMDGKLLRTIEHFPYPDLSGMRIPVPELLSNPELFRIDFAGATDLWKPGRPELV
jgi:hypothetical protein